MEQEATAGLRLTKDEAGVLTELSEVRKGHSRLCQLVLPAI